MHKREQDITRIARVFPRKTTASPDDELAFFGPPPADFTADIDEVHVSVTFTYDMAKAERLATDWKSIAPVQIGGPACGDHGGDFTPGMYLKHGYLMTSRGCPNNCWFCDVHKREGGIRELPIHEGWNLLDSNILACSTEHILEVFKMMKKQPKRAQLTGGLEAKVLTHTHVTMLWNLRPDQMFFAYDTPDDLEHLRRAGEKLRYADFTRRHLRCYVLIGWPQDTITAAKKRLLEAWEAGFMPMAMLWKNKEGDTDKEWRRFQRAWARPAMTRNVVKDAYCCQA
jgi:hypothetical protein